MSLYRQCIISTKSLSTMCLSTILVLFIDDLHFDARNYHCNSRTIVTLLFLLCCICISQEETKSVCLVKDYWYIASKDVRQSSFRQSVFRLYGIRQCSFRRSSCSIMLASARVSAMSLFGDLVFAEEPYNLFFLVDDFPNTLNRIN